jgi:hypothetical protein
MLCSIFFSYEMQIQRKTHSLWSFIRQCGLRLLQNCLPPLLFSQIPLLDVILNHGTSTMLKNGALTHPSGPIFNIAW